RLKVAMKLHWQKNEPESETFVVDIYPTTGEEWDVVIASYATAKAAEAQTIAGLIAERETAKAAEGDEKRAMNSAAAAWFFSHPEALADWCYKDRVSFRFDWHGGEKQPCYVPGHPVYEAAWERANAQRAEEAARANEERAAAEAEREQARTMKAAW